MYPHWQHGPVDALIWEILLEIHEAEIRLVGALQEGGQTSVLGKLLWNFNWYVQIVGCGGN